MSGLVSVQNTVDTGHEDMIVSWFYPILEIFSIFRQMKQSNVAVSQTI